MLINPIVKILSDAVIKGDLDSIQKIVLSHPMSARWSSEEDIPLITLAVQSGRLDIVILLVENKARLNWVSPNIDENLYLLAKRLGHSSMANYLKPLMDPDLQKVVDSKAKANENIFSKSEDTMKYDELNDELKLFEKIKENDIECICQMLGNRININIRFEDDITPLIFAVKQGNLEIVQLLVQAGADINALDADFESALLIAKMQDFDTIADYLAPLTSDEIRAVVDEQMSN